MPDTLAPLSEQPVIMRQADTWVVTVGTYSHLLKCTLWSAEAFTELNEAVDFYGDLESGERKGIPGAVTAYKDGRVIGDIPMRRVAAMIREADTGGYHP